jgi:hypothetical protein
MAKQFRGVVIGNTWRLIHRMHTFGPDSRMRRDPRGDNWLPQAAPLEPLVRRALLYFDRIEWPNNNALPMGEIPHAEILEQSGVLHRKMLVFPNPPPPPIADFLASTLEPGSMMGVHGDAGLQAHLITAFHFDAFRTLDRESPGCWALATIGQGLDVLDAVETRGVQIALHNALPVPMPDCSYEKILQFKQNREAELLTFRAHMDELYLQIVNSGDAPMAQQAVLHKIDESLVAVSRTLTEASIRSGLQTFHIDVSTEARRAAAVAGLAAAKSAAMLGQPFGFDFPLLNAAVGGLTGAVVRLLVNPKRVESPIERLGAFKYLYEAARAGVIPFRADNPDLAGNPDVVGPA